MTLSFGWPLLVSMYLNLSPLPPILARLMSSASSITGFGLHITVPIFSLLLSDWIYIFFFFLTSLLGWGIERERKVWGWRNYMGNFALFLLPLWSHTALGPSPNSIACKLSDIRQYTSFLSIGLSFFTCRMEIMASTSQGVVRTTWDHVYGGEHQIRGFQTCHHSKPILSSSPTTRQGFEIIFY